VIGGEDGHDYYLSDVHIFDTGINLFHLFHLFTSVNLMMHK